MTLFKTEICNLSPSNDEHFSDSGNLDRIEEP